MGAQVLPLQGDRQMVIATLGIAPLTEGFDLDQNGTIDNKLGAIGSLANPQMAASFSKKHDIVIPLELFGYTGQDTACAKLAVYVGAFNQDRDQDGTNTTWDKGDCLDVDPNVHPGQTEASGNRLDDDCDGFADNATPGMAPSGDDADKDLDGDGYTLAMGDCDDRNDTPDHLALAKSRHPGAPDLCGDGIDQNCDGVPDNDPSCNPFGENDSSVMVTSTSFIDPGATPLQPSLAFKEGSAKAGLFAAGPDQFTVTVPIQGRTLKLELTGSHIQMNLSDDGEKTHATGGLIGGVLEAVSLAKVTNLNFSGVIKPDQSLFDAIFVGAVSAVLGLDSDDDGHYLPDIDVDGDGLETFYNTNGPLPSGSMVVDTCKDGDGTIVMSTPDTPCVFAKDAKGNYRFVDGLSAALKFTAVPARLDPTVVP
jgi:hypothetical protein